MHLSRSASPRAPQSPPFPPTPTGGLLSCKYSHFLKGPTYASGVKRLAQISRRVYQQLDALHHLQLLRLYRRPPHSLADSQSEPCTWGTLAGDPKGPLGLNGRFSVDVGDELDGFLPPTRAEKLARRWMDVALDSLMGR